MHRVLEQLECRMLLNADAGEIPAEIASEPEEIIELELNSEIFETGIIDDEPGDDSAFYYLTSTIECGDRWMSPDDWVDDAWMEDGEQEGEADHGETDEEDSGDEGMEGDIVDATLRQVTRDDGSDDGHVEDGWCPVLYTLGGSDRPGGPDHQGPDETEPNDTIDTATVVDLQPIPTFAPGVSLFGAELQGIAGGAENDQDVFAFEVEAGYHVTLGVQSQIRDGDQTYGSLDEWIFANGLNEYGDAPDTLYAGGTPLFDESTGETINRVAYIVGNHPDLVVAHAAVVVYDSAGNAVAKSGGDARSFGVDFYSETGGIYYAMVVMDESASSGDLIPYQLGIMAQSGFDIRYVIRGNSGESGAPRVVVLQGGESFEYVDSSGDDVQVEFRGRGKATITFSGQRANGSDIVSIVINGGRRGQLTVLSDDGSVNVGSIEIHGSQSRNARRNSGFGRIEIDGNLGSLTSHLNVRELVVDGMLGDLAATGAVVGRLQADMFDAGNVDEDSIVKLHVKEDNGGDIMKHLLSLI